FFHLSTCSVVTWEQFYRGKVIFVDHFLFLSLLFMMQSLVACVNILILRWSQILTVRIPSSEEKSVEGVTLHISSKEYYLNIIANELGLEDASNVFISRF
ncbi:hypothetical protein S245_055745, partial [Arachis hypogaea]